MPDVTEAPNFSGRMMVDSEGEKIGKIDELYYDEQGGQSEWALVDTGLFGTKKTFVPIRSATTAGEDVHVPVSKQQVKDAPRVDADQELSAQEERRLFEHYGVPYTTAGSTTAEGSPSAGQSGAIDDEKPAVIGSVRTEQEGEHGRPRLRKYVVTEDQEPVVGSVRTSKRPGTG